MAQFYTGEALAEKLYDIIWHAKKKLLILSPFIHLDDYCKEIFKNYKHYPELKVVLVFGKNEREAGKGLNKNDLDFLKNGHADKFMGGAVMNVFGGDCHLDRAIDAALAAKNQLMEWQKLT